LKTRVFPFGILFLIFQGCVVSPTPLPEEAPVFLSDSRSPEASRAFQKALSAEESILQEKARIDYLLEGISACPYNFIRNGRSYDGKRAAAHLRWKHFRRRSKVKTAEDFIAQVANGSKMSGEPYGVEFPGKKRYPLRPILEKELKAFDEALRYKKTGSQPLE